MHEQSIVTYLLNEAVTNARKENASKIISIKLTVGELTGVEKDAVIFYFGFLAKNTIAEGATLEFEYTKAKLRCRECDIIFPKERSDFICPQCNKKVVEIVGGRELYIESMEVI
jgi:hydrogenase nickel incorporation protein HypA/HybF